MDYILNCIKIILLCNICCFSCGGMYPCDSDYRAVRAEDRRKKEQKRLEKEQKRFEKEQKQQVRMMVVMMMNQRYDPDTALGLTKKILGYL